MSILTLRLLLLAPLIHIIHAKCYFPNGETSYADVACDSSATDSFCCFSNQACLSNKLCYDIGNRTYARGTCTDQTWQSSACPNFCNDASNLGNPVFSCNGTASGDSYCCNDGCSCGSGNEVLSFAGEPYTKTIIGQRQTFANPSSTGSGTSSLTDAAVSTTSFAGSSSGVAPSAGAASTGASSSSSGVDVGVGVGVGVGGAAILGAILAFFIFRRRRARKSARVVGDGFGGGTGRSPMNKPRSPYHENRPTELDSQQKLPVLEMGSEIPQSELYGEPPVESVSTKHVR